jgi:hypothetical protein
MTKGQHARNAKDQVKADGVNGKDEDLDGKTLNELGLSAAVDKDRGRRCTIEQADDEMAKGSKAAG